MGQLMPISDGSELPKGGTGPPSSRGILGRSARVVALMLALALGTTVLFSILHIPVSLAPIKKMIEVKAEEMLGLNVIIEGPIRLIPGRQPAIELQGLRFRKPPDNQSESQGADILALAELKVSLAIMPLFKKTVRLTEILGQGINLNLVQLEDRPPPQPPETEKSSFSQGRPPSPWQLEVIHLEIDGATVALGPGASPEIITFAKITGAATAQKGLDLNALGIYRTIDWHLALNGRNLPDLWQPLLLAPSAIAANPAEQQSLLTLSLDALDGTVTGAATLSREGPGIQLAVDVSGNQINLGQLSKALPGESEIAGSIKAFTATAASHGTDLDTLVQSLTVALDLRNAEAVIRHTEKGTPHQLQIDDAHLALPAGGILTGSVTGGYREQPFALEVTGGAVGAIHSESGFPLDIRFSGSGAQLHAQGHWSFWDAATGSELAFSLSGDRLGDLAAWTGVSPAAGLPYDLSTTFQYNPSQGNIEIRKLRLGDSTLKGNIGLKKPVNRPPHIDISLTADTVDLDQLATVVLLPEKNSPIESPAQVAGPPPDEFAPILETVVFPENWHLPEMDIDLRAGQILNAKLPITDCRLQARVRRDRIAASKFQFQSEETRFSGSVSLNSGQQPPQLGLRFSASQFDVGHLLETLEIAAGVEARADRLEILFATQGRQLADLIRHRKVTLDIRHGHWTITDANTQAKMVVDLERVEFSNHPGNPFALTMAGQNGGAPP